MIIIIMFNLNLHFYLLLFLLMQIFKTVWFLFNKFIKPFFLEENVLIYSISGLSFKASFKK